MSHICFSGKFYGFRERFYGFRERFEWPTWLTIPAGTALKKDDLIILYFQGGLFISKDNGEFFYLISDSIHLKMLLDKEVSFFIEMSNLFLISTSLQLL